MSEKQLQAQRIIEERKRILAAKVKQQQEQQRLEAERLAAEKKRKELEKWRKLKGFEDKPKKIKKQVTVSSEDTPAPLHVGKEQPDEAPDEAGVGLLERAESDMNPLELAYSVDLSVAYSSKPEVFEDPVDELNRICEDSLNSRLYAPFEASSDESAAFERDEEVLSGGSDEYAEDFESLNDSLEEEPRLDKRVAIKPSLLTESLQFDIASEMNRIQAFEKARNAELLKNKDTVRQRLLHNLEAFEGLTEPVKTPILEPDSPVRISVGNIQIKEVDTGGSDTGSSFESDVNARATSDAEDPSSSSSEFERAEAESVANCMITQLDDEWDSRETATFPGIKASSNEFVEALPISEDAEVLMSPAFTERQPMVLAEPKAAFLLVGEEEGMDDKYERARKKKLQLLAERRLARKQPQEHSPDLVLETPTRREASKAAPQIVEECKSVKRDDLSEKYKRHKKLPQLVYQKPSNRKLVQNAITKVCCAGAANSQLRDEALKALESRPDALNFIIVFKGNLGRKDLRALYELSEGAVHKVFGPSNCPEEIVAADVKSFFRYDSGAKEFKMLQCKSFSINTDAVVLV